MKRWIKRDRSIIIAADVPTLETLEKLVESTCGVEGIGGYKVGLELALMYGLPQIVKVIRRKTELPIIYDHQKGGSDIPELGEKFAKVCKKVDIDGIIIFPFGGKETEITWIKACQKEGLKVIVGAHMTQPKFLVKEGGFIADKAPEKIFKIALKYNVKDFVVPGNKLIYVKKYKKLFDRFLGKNNFTLYAPGFITQGGEISKTGKVAGKRWHAIVGRAICKAKNPKLAAENLVKQIIK